MWDQQSNQRVKYSIAIGKVKVKFGSKDSKGYTILPYFLAIIDVDVFFILKSNRDTFAQLVMLHYACLMSLKKVAGTNTTMRKTGGTSDKFRTLVTGHI